jgi:SpoVK/Ycf46/Vps4 family AAA+-type ATPase
MQAYSDSREHLFDELRRLDLLLNLGVARLRSDPAFASFNEFRGLFIAEDEIDAVLGGRRGGAPNAEEAAIVEAIRRAEESVAARVAATVAAGTRLSLFRLAELFGLVPFDIDALLVCLAPELDLKYAKLYAYLQNDVTRKKPSVDLLLGLFCRTPGERVAARARLTPEAPLVSNGLLVLAADSPAEQTSLLSRSARVDERILNYLLESDAPDMQLSQFASVVEPRATLAESLLPTDLKERLARLISHGARGVSGATMGNSLALLLTGEEGAGKRYTAEALCARAGLGMIVADAATLLWAQGSVEQLVTRLFREARLREAAIYVDRAEALLEGGERAEAARAALLRAARVPGVVTFLGSTSASGSGGSFDRDPLVRVALPAPGFDARRRFWNLFLARSGGETAPVLDLDGLADRFAFTAGKIRRAVAEAGQYASMRAEEARVVTTEDLYAAARTQSSRRLAALARKIEPLYTWDDIILPPARLEHLREVCSHALHRQRVFGEWGFNRKLSLGKGLGVLFVGQSGTGKTMAAEIIAGELRLDLYKIDLSCVVSKYIGETEKNLGRIFDEAAETNAVLFFDEADAVFGKRSEVKDSHDRYANIEVNFLLQRVEEYEGTVILASNFRKNIDEAFIRRLRFIIEFPFPDARHRRRIWRQMFPSDAPLDPDIDWDFLAERFELTGGHIKNIALGAAFLAATEGEPVRMSHLVHATRREFQKTGRLCVRADFEHYFDLIDDEEEVLA